MFNNRANNKLHVLLSSYPFPFHPSIKFASYKIYSQNGENFKMLESFELDESGVEDYAGEQLTNTEGGCSSTNVGTG